MASFTVKTFDELVTDMVSWIVAHSPQITDLSPGSIIRSFCESSALCMEEFYVATYLGFRRYLETVSYDIFDFQKKAGAKATTNVQFSRSGSTGVATIPVGTRVQTASGLKFLTTVIGYILDGDTNSGDVPVAAEKVGFTYNVLSGTITTMTDAVDGVESVTNPNASTGGVDDESDYSYKQRFQAYIEGLGRSNIAGLIAGALSVEGITSASVVELIPPESNVNVQLYVDDSSSGGVSVSKLAEVQSVIDGDGTETNPGYRAAGVNVVVLAPGIVVQAVAATVIVTDTGIDLSQVTLDVNNAITTYINNLGVGKDIVWAKLIEVIMEVYGVYDCTVTNPTAPGVTIGSDQVGRVGVITITFS